MSAFNSLLEKFHGSIIANDGEKVLPEIKSRSNMGSKQKMAIYIDGYRIRLTQAIRSDYPALLALLGDKRFDELAQNYIENNPPTHFNLDRYPHAFATFINKNIDDKFAAELAALESSIAQVFMLDESEPLDPAALTGLTPDSFAAVILRPRVASQLLSFTYPVNDWLLAQRNSNIIDRPSQADTFLYIYRHHNNVQREPIERAAYLLLEQFGKGLTVGEAFDHMEKTWPEHSATIATNLQGWFADWMQKGFFRK